MSETSHRDLIDRLRERAGDGLKMLIRFTRDDSEFLYGQDWFEEFLAENDTRSPDEMHRDAVYRLEQAEVSGQLYGSPVRSDIQITGEGIGIFLYPGDGAGYYVWIDRGTSVEIPDLVDDSLDVFGASA